MAHAFFAAIEDAYRSKHPDVILKDGIWEHVRLGKLSYLDLGVYCALLRNCCPETGRWLGNAGDLAHLAPKANPSTRRNIQRSLIDLEKIKFIRIFDKITGSSKPYRILINKYEPTIGIHSGKRLDAWASPDWEHPKFE
jgi:hypothetical protein